MSILNYFRKLCNFGECLSWDKLPKEIKDVHRYNRDKIESITVMQRIEVVDNKCYHTYQYNPISDKWIQMSIVGKG